MSFVAKESSFREERDLLLRKKEEELLEQEKKLDLFLEEKGEWMKQRNHLEKELAKYKQRAEESMFLDASNMAFSNKAGFSKPLHSSPAINPVPSSLTPTLATASGKKPAAIGMVGRPIGAKGDQTSYNTDGTITPRRVLRTEAPEFIPAGMSISCSSSAVKSHSIGLSTYTSKPWEPIRSDPGLSEVTAGVKRSYGNPLSTPDNPSGSPTAGKHPWRQTGEQRKRNGFDSYESGLLDGMLHARYSAMFDLGSRDDNRRFNGKRSDYPIFRQQLVRDYAMLWNSDPYTLLQKIANSVTDAVYEHIKSAWVIRNPQDAIERIWEILEDFMAIPGVYWTTLSAM